MQENIREPGFYLFPGMEESSGMTPEQKKAAEQNWMEKYRTGPHGILVFQPRGGQLQWVPLFLTELATNIVAGWIAAFLLAQTLAGFGTRVLMVALLGLLASVVVDFSYWNWYGFPTEFLLASLADQVIGFTLAGLALAAIVKPPVG